MGRRKVYSGLRGFQAFADHVGLSDEVRGVKERLLQESYMPFLCTEYYAELIAAQAEPYKTELMNVVLPPTAKKKYRGRFDPYGNVSYGQDEKVFLQHKYKNTLLLHFIDVCIANCQFCYKVNEIRVENSSKGRMDIKIDKALAYLDTQPDVNNILFTGGDPAVVKSGILVNSLSRLLDHPHVRFVRFATKGLAFDPERFLEPEFLDFCRSLNERERKQLIIIVQFNHPAEFSPLARNVLQELRQAGVQLRGQPAVIRGVNDSVETLTDLQRTFIDNGVVSYYLTTFMPVRGVEQYGLALDEVFARVSESKRNLNGLEKKGVLLASHDFGKFEIVGFYPNVERPQKIVLKWHQAAMERYLPGSLKQAVPSRPEDLLILDYAKGEIFSIDHLFRFNGLPHYNPEGELVEPENANTLNVVPDKQERNGQSGSPLRIALPDLSAIHSGRDSEQLKAG